jgi:MarR family transcriptional regulator, lower aerobic nicotinate degradation pathway regulator
MARTGRSVERSAGAPNPRGFPDNLTAMLRLTGLYRRRFQQLLAEEPWVAESGAKPPTYGVLSVVKERGPVSQREVCDWLGVHASDMVELVDHLEGLHWVERRRDPVDRRRYQLTITPEGRKTLARYDALAAQAEDSVLEPLSDVERRRLIDLVTKVVSSHARD